MAKNKSTRPEQTEREEIFRRVFENSAEGAILIDEDGRITEWNRFMEIKTDISKGNAVGKKIWDVQHSLMTNDLMEKYTPGALETIWMNFINTMADDKTISREGHYIGKNGNIILTEDILYKFQIKSKKYMYVIQRDLTERRNLEQQLKNNEQKLSHIIATKDKIISIISHDLRNPLTTVLGFSRLILDNTGSPDTGNNDEFVKHINSSAMHSLRLLDNLLIWSKSQTGQLSVNPGLFSLNSLIREILDGLEPAALLKKIKLNYTASDYIEAFADADIIKIVLRNIVHNAIKFTGEEGKIDIDAVKHNDQLEITVEDNGTGMDDEMKSRIFEFGFNKSHAGTANESGSGLGLVLCRELIEKHNGKLQVESAPGKGSKFTISLQMQDL